MILKSKTYGLDKGINKIDYDSSQGVSRLIGSLDFSITWHY